jgi:hypothetical protein
MNIRNRNVYANSRRAVRIPNEEVIQNPIMAMEFDNRGNVQDGSKVSMFKEVKNITGER